MAKWIIQKQFEDKPKLKSPILISGLPGIGNVGKIVVDYLIDSMQPKELYTIYSHSFPHSVFINEDNLIDMPSVALYVLKGKKQDFLLLAGDIQPATERASYEFCEKVLDLAEELGCKEILTLGGIGLNEEPKAPKIYGIANDEQALKDYKKKCKELLCKDSKAVTIVGAAGLLLGLGKLRNMKGVSLLAETLGHPYHVGLKEASVMVGTLKSLFDLDVDLEAFEKEIKQEEINKTREASRLQRKPLLKRFKQRAGDDFDINYIG